jgi:hypothetical protein
MKNGGNQRYPECCGQQRHYVDAGQAGQGWHRQTTRDPANGVDPFACEIEQRHASASQDHRDQRTRRARKRQAITNDIASIAEPTARVGGWTSCRWVCR